MFDAPLVLDAMEVVYLAKIGGLDLLAQVVPQPVYVGLCVAREAQYFRDAHGNRQPIDLTPLVERGVIQIVSMEGEEELALFAAFARDGGLGDGEGEACTLAVSRGWHLVTDDGAARKAWEREFPDRDALGIQRLLQHLVDAGALSAERRAQDLLRCFPGGLPRRA